MAIQNLRSFGYDVSDALQKALRGYQSRHATRLRLCAQAIQTEALALRDNDDSVCSLSLAMGFRTAFSALLHITEDRIDPKRYTCDIRAMMGEMFKSGEQLAEGLVLRPLHNSVIHIGNLVRGSKDQILTNARDRILRQIERGTAPSEATVVRWSKLGARTANRLSILAFEREYLKTLVVDEEPKFQTAGLLTEAMRVALFISDLRRVQLVFTPTSARELWAEQ